MRSFKAYIPILRGKGDFRPLKIFLGKLIFKPFNSRNYASKYEQKKYFMIFIVLPLYAIL